MLYFRFCMECNKLTPVIYNFDTREYECWLCGKVYEIPEHKLSKVNKIKNKQ